MCTDQAKERRLNKQWTTYVANVVADLLDKTQWRGHYKHGQRILSKATLGVDQTDIQYDVVIVERG